MLITWSFALFAITHNIMPCYTMAHDTPRVQNELKFMRSATHVAILYASMPSALRVLTIASLIQHRRLTIKPTNKKHHHALTHTITRSAINTSFCFHKIH